jgi:hypothetical protein
MSRQPILSKSLVVGSLAAISCVSAEKVFDDFDDRVGTRDGGGSDGAELSEIPDISGEHFLVIDPVPISPGNLLRFIATVDLELAADRKTATMSLTIQPIDVANGELVAEPLPFENIAINAAGRFTVELMTDSDAIPGEANPVTGSDIGVNGELAGELREGNADLFCGTASGNVIPTGTPIDGSTFGAIRIAPGTTGNGNLPEPVAACPVDEALDAGVDASGS